MALLTWFVKKTTPFQMFQERGGNELFSSSYHLEVPTLSGLEREIAQFNGEEGAKQRLLNLAEYGKDFHSSVSLFVGNYTLGKSSNFTYALEHDKPVEPWMVQQLRSFGERIRSNGEKNSPHTLRRCTAANELQRIIESTPETISEAAKVIGYMDRGSSEISSIFSGFGFFYEHDSENLPPQILWDSYQKKRIETETLALRAREEFHSLSPETQYFLGAWVGFYGHKSLRGLTRTTIDFKDNKPDRVTQSKVLPAIPAAPIFGKDIFYKRFGEDLLRGYGLMERT